jgi:hypothetical protein
VSGLSRIAAVRQRVYKATRCIIGCLRYVGPTKASKVPPSAHFHSYCRAMYALKANPSAKPSELLTSFGAKQGYETRSVSVYFSEHMIMLSFLGMPMDAKMMNRRITSGLTWDGLIGQVLTVVEETKLVKFHLMLVFVSGGLRLAPAAIKVKLVSWTPL